MCTFIKFFQVLVVVVLLSASGNTKRKKNKFSSENDVLEKSEVTLKFPTYALKMPPIITSRKRTNAKIDPVPVSCKSSNVTRSLNELRKKIRCIPRDTVVEVAAPDSSKVIPNTVVVKRCGGMCSGSKKCLPKKRTNVDFYVRTTDQKSGMVFCSRISVPEDTECQCDCPEKKRCSVDQKFDPTLCKCVCTNKEEERDCVDKADVDSNFKWSAKTCSCGCRREKICTTGTTWERTECRCVKA
ncbi:balbiani ring protein 3-like [Zophobas morio]|uniref:balbiani ring protein 3-like n=1 Tax=Zophobas morio TaxID=2755281 RepID=UPI0030833DB9